MIPIIIGFLATAGVIGYSIYAAGEEEREWQEELKREEERIVASQINDIDQMTGIEFEKYISLCYRKIGYLAELTSGSQDYGADILLYENNIKNGIKTVVQAKRWANKVGVKAIQETIAAKQYYKADQGIVITNSYFTKNAVHLAESTDIDLWDRETLIDFILHIENDN